MRESLIKSYAGVETPAWLLIDKVKFPPLPDVENTSISLPKRSGALFIDKKYGTRKIEIDLTVVAETREGVMYKGDSLATFLDHDEPQPIVFRDMPDRTYYAILEGGTDLEKVERFGKGTITLICYDPHGYGLTREYTFAPQNTSPIIYDNLGNKETYPKFDMTFTKNLTDFAIVSGEDALIFGDFNVVDDTAKDLKPLYIDDTGATTSGWTQGVTVDGGVVSGELSSNGYTFQQKDKNYGEVPDKWHGGSLIKPLGKQVQDFLLSCRIGFTSDNVNQLGRIDFYLLDANGNKIGKMAMRDNHANADLPNFEAWAGGVGNGGISFRNTYGNYTGQYKGGFDGILRIGRDGLKWYCYIAKLDSNNKHIESTIMKKEYWDRAKKYQDKVAAIQIHIGAYKAYAPVKNMWISNIRFFEELKASNSNEKDYVFKTGDRLQIDCETMEVFKNGERFFDKLQASSSFIKFKKGTNGISVSDPSIKDGKLTYTERWL